MEKKFYITTAIAYVNAPPHIGFALELLQADVLARYHRSIGDDTRFLTGTDEHGAKIVKAAEQAGRDTKEFVDETAEKFRSLTKALNVSNDDFIRTSDNVRHWPGAQKIWRELAAKGDLYKKNYEGLYCVGHEAFVKKSDLVDGLCPLHKTEPEKIKEENWFFKLTKYKNEVKKRIENDELKIIPASRKNEILNLFDDAEDVSFSRPSKDIRWGIPVPGDDTQTMYVWADALTNYISALGYGTDEENLEKYWPADAHLVGKDILRFHAMIWPAMLLSAELPLPKSIYVHGFITVDGEKMSKTIGNVVDPFALVEKYGSETVRYFLLREIPSGDDGDFSFKKLEERYNGDLANGLGNLVQRVATLIDTKMAGELIYRKDVAGSFGDEDFLGFESFSKHIEAFELHKALEHIWSRVATANAFIDTRKPWVEIKENDKKFLETMTHLLVMIRHIAWLLKSFLPETSQKIFDVFGDDQTYPLPDGHKFIIKKGEPLFPRLSQ
jgi:methionyl-tRNA synthetase